MTIYLLKLSITFYQKILMGCETSVECYSDDDIPLLERLKSNITVRDFERLRQRGSALVNQSVLYSIGQNCGNMETKDFPKTLQNACYICVNSKHPKTEETSVGCFNDAILIAQHYQSAGYNVFFIVNPKSMTYFTFLRLVLSQTTNNVAVYISGFCKDAEGKNEIIFEDENVPSKRFSDFLNAYKKITSMAHIIFDFTHIKKKNALPHSTFISNTLTANTIFITLDFVNNLNYDNLKVIECGGYITFMLMKFLKAKPDMLIGDLKKGINDIINQFGYEIFFRAQNRQLLNGSLFTVSNANQQQQEMENERQPQVEEPRGSPEEENSKSGSHKSERKHRRRRRKKKSHSSQSDSSESLYSSDEASAI
ncbi:hypothetical protein TRFO_31392 [Tritrichomonas foetus]|uniref:Clan CD, family C14, metacaspase-like cysteine peptidase n=1 Tax=Tritrichomonas foetus TaxID=1144522 RepID=A0A1J4JRB2_9EUKA|nr:hypothetical protein TRFO_31392 [Tritrichomonas foetus]|eukprot:OHT01695.1 hypothetical protein TRFO_31392 [Tritrichomonas foetus]